MKNHMLIIFVLAVTLSACKKDEGVIKADILSTPLATTPYGFTCDASSNYLYFSNSSSASYGGDGIYTFQNTIMGNNPNLSIVNTINYLQTDNFEVSDSEFYNYFKLVDYEYITPTTPTDLSQSKYYVGLQLTTPTNGYVTYYSKNISPLSSFTIVDTIHTTYQNKTAIKYRATFECTMANSPEGDSIRVKNGVIVGLFIKPFIQ